jgi:hypothetical protein
METASFKELEEAKGEIIEGVAFTVHTTPSNQYGMMSKTYSTVENGNFYEVTDPQTGITEFWSDKHSASRYYDGRTREELIRQYEEKIAAIEKEKEQLAARAKSMRTPTGTRMTQEDYARLAESGGALALGDAEAILLINKEFGFEAARLEILREAEVDVTEEGARRVKTEKAKREPMYAASDWNYIRFNVRTAPATWYYEMINANLREVLL